MFIALATGYLTVLKLIWGNMHSTTGYLKSEVLRARHDWVGFDDQKRRNVGQAVGESGHLSSQVEREKLTWNRTHDGKNQTIWLSFN